METARSALRWGAGYLSRRGIADATREAWLILGLALGEPHPLAAGDRRLARDELDTYRALAGRRGRRVPLAYLAGGREFWSRPFAVTACTLIPRPETETLVETVRGALPGTARIIADVGTGSGVIAVTLALLTEGLEIIATDSWGPALGIARQNARRHGVEGRIRFLRGHLLDPLRRRGPLDAVVCNPPYVASAEHRRLEPEVRCHEPARALIGGPDGLFHIRRLVRGSGTLLRPGGLLACEIGRGQRPAVDALLTASPDWMEWHWTRDLAGIDRVVIARRGDR